jgi:hypothetical protein
MNNHPSDHNNNIVSAHNDNHPATRVAYAQESGTPQPAPQIAVLELNYHQIASLYDMAEDLLGTAEDVRVKNHEEQLDLIEPLVAQIGETADILCEEFIEVAGNKQRSPARKNRIESAMRRLYMAIDDYSEKANHMARGAVEGIRNIADVIVEKIKHHIEFVITIFVDFIALSLEQIMSKARLMELKRRQEKIAEMLFMAERRAALERGF